MQKLWMVQREIHKDSPKSNLVCFWIQKNLGLFPARNGLGLGVSILTKMEHLPSSLQILLWQMWSSILSNYTNLGLRMFTSSPTFAVESLWRFFSNHVDHLWICFEGLGPAKTKFFLRNPTFGKEERKYLKRTSTAQCSGILCRRYHSDVHSARAQRVNNIVETANIGGSPVWCEKNIQLSLAVLK